MAGCSQLLGGSGAQSPTGERIAVALRIEEGLTLIKAYSLMGVSVHHTALVGEGRASPNSLAASASRTPPDHLVCGAMVRTTSRPCAVSDVVRSRGTGG